MNKIKTRGREGSHSLRLLFDSSIFWDIWYLITSGSDNGINGLRFCESRLDSYIVPHTIVGFESINCNQNKYDITKWNRWLLVLFIFSISHSKEINYYFCDKIYIWFLSLILKFRDL